jgi:hypothetical protein
MHIEAYTRQDKDAIYIKLNGNDESNYYFLETLGEKLPLSIHSDDIQEVDILDVSDDVKYYEAFRNLGLSSESISSIFTPNSPNYYNPFITHSFFGRNYSYLDTSNIEDYTIFRHHHKDDLYIKEDEKIYKVENNKDAFKELANHLKSGKLVKVKTNFESRVFGLNTKDVRAKFIDYTFFITDQFVLDYKFDISEFEVKTLNSIEKPKVRLKLSEPIDNKDFAFVKLPDDGFSYLLANESKDIGLDYLLYTTNDIKADVELFFNSDINIQKDLEMFCVDENSFILEGERAIYPKICNSIDNGLFLFANDICALRISDNRYLLNKKEQFLDVDINIEKAKLLNRDFSDIDSAIESVRCENSIKDETINLYLSTNSYNSSLQYKDKKISILNLDKSLNYHLKLIDKSEDEYISDSKYPLDILFDFIAHILKVEKKDFYFYYGDSEEFEIYTIDINGELYLDYRDILLYIYRAKDENKNIKFIINSIFKSLSNYFCYNINKISNEFNIKKVVICGNILSSYIFVEYMYKNLENFDIYKNIEFPIDKTNQIYGAISL